MYVRQENNKIILYQGIPSEDRDRVILKGSKEEIQDIVTVLNKALKDYTYKIPDLVD